MSFFVAFIVGFSVSADPCKGFLPVSDGHSSFATSAYICWVPLLCFIVFVSCSCAFLLSLLSQIYHLRFSAPFPSADFLQTMESQCVPHCGVPGFNELATQVHA